MFPSPTLLALVLNIFCSGHSSTLRGSLDAASSLQPGGDCQGVSFSDRKPVIWVHLHNAGGTSICQLADKAGERAATDDNCNVHGDDCDPKGRHIRCHERVRDTEFTFSMIERAIDDADMCHGALMGISMREPLAHMTSTLVNNEFYTQKAALITMLKTKVVTPIWHSGWCLPDWDTYQHFDNFATRILGGAYFEGIGEVTARHLDNAKKRLEKMDVVVMLEKLARDKDQFVHTFGWKMQDLTIEHARSHNRSLSEFFTKDDVSFLAELNSYDMQLHEYAEKLASRHTKAARQALQKAC